MSWQEVLRFLVVFAHPDDASYFCGGSLRRWANEGHEVYLAVMTDGSKGSVEPIEPKRLAEIRREEELQSVKVLGAKEVFFFNYVDGELHRAADLDERLTFLIRKLQPHVLITQDPWKRYELHRDHRVAGMAALDARLSAKLPTYYPHQLTDDVQTSNINTILLYHSDEPNLWVDITTTLDQKFEALFMHRSQFPPNEKPVREILTQEMQENGKKINVEFAEAFKKIELDGTMPHVKIY